MLRTQCKVEVEAQGRGQQLDVERRTSTSVLHSAPPALRDLLIHAAPGSPIRGASVGRGVDFIFGSRPIRHHSGRARSRALESDAVGRGLRFSLLLLPLAFHCGTTDITQTWPF